MSMHPTHIRKGDLVIDMWADGNVQIVRQSNATGIVLSLSEYKYLVTVAEIHGWPVLPPDKPNPEKTT